MRKYPVKLWVLYIVRARILFRIQWMHSEGDFAAILKAYLLNYQERLGV